jgi:hypothetical protein
MSMRPPTPQRARHRRRVGGKSQHPEDHHEGELEPALPILGQMAARVQTLNRRSTGDWSSDDYRELERLAEQLLAAQEAIGKEQHANNPHAQQQLVEIGKMQLRMLLQSLQPPPELLDLFTKLWARCRSSGPRDGFARQTLMNASVRRDVLNRQVEEAVDEADEEATLRRVEAIDADTGGGGSQPESPPQEPEAKAPANTLKKTLKLLRKKRRDLSPPDVEDVATKALDVMRVMRDEIAPRWAPETQPWLLNTADTHVYQTVLAVIPEDLFKQSNAFQGIQNLRAGEHAFTFRAQGQIDAGAKRS